jgi:hypothetical protein
MTPTEAVNGVQTTTIVEKKNGGKKGEKAGVVQIQAVTPAPVVTYTKPTPLACPLPLRGKSKTKLLFSPRAFAKIEFMRKRGKVEVSGFGISSEDDPLYVADFKLVEQNSMPAFTEFIDNALAGYVEDMCMAGIPPARSFRVWIHTHPGMSSSPSTHDERTFERTSEMADWGVMCIVGDKDVSAQLVVNAGGLSAERKLKVEIDFNGVFEGVTAEDYEEWDAEYCRCVNIQASTITVQDRWGSDWQGGRYGGIWGDVGDDLYSAPDPVSAPQEVNAEEDFPDVNGEVVESVEVGADGYAYVFTENLWLQYGNMKEIHCDPGDTLKDIYSVSYHLPYEYGVRSLDEPTTVVTADDVGFAADVSQEVEIEEEREVVVGDHTERSCDSGS